MDDPDSTYKNHSLGSHGNCKPTSSLKNHVAMFIIALAFGLAGMFGISAVWYLTGCQ